MRGATARRAAAAALLAVTGALAQGSCANLEAIPGATCGNAVIDVGEDCDGFDLTFGDGDEITVVCRGPGIEGACRFDCSAGAPCPPGYGCGIDAICRAPSGALEQRPGGIDEDAAWLFARDFDADGVPDLYAQTSGGPVVLYLGEDFDLDEDRDLVALRSSFGAAFGELTGAEPLDLAFLSYTGVGVLRGETGRELLGTAYPSFSLPQVDDTVVFGLDADRALAGVEPVALLQLPGAAIDVPFPITIVTLVTSASIATSEQFLLSRLLTLPLIIEGGERHIDAIPAADLDPATPCDEFVLAFRNANRVIVGTPCQPNGELNGASFEPDDPATVQPTPIPMIDVDLSGCDAAGSFEVDRAFVADEDGDGQVDVVMSRRGVPRSGAQDRADAPSGAWCVARGPFAFAATDGDLPPHPAAPAPALRSATPDERALLVERLDDDDVLDLVTSSGIFLGSPVPCPLGFPARPGDPHDGIEHCDVTPVDVDLVSGAFISAASGDVNGDGVRDVVVTDGASGRVLAHLGVANGTYAAFVLDADGAPDHLATGDFDGDGIEDIAYADRACEPAACTATTPGDSLAVSFGRHGGGPEEPRNLGRTGRARQVLALDVTSPFWSGVDSATDLGILFGDTKSVQQLSFATLYGDTARQLQAPFTLYSGGAVEGALFVPVQIAIGQFAEPSGPGVYGVSPGAGAAAPHLDIAVAAMRLNEAGELEEPPRLWLLAAEGEAELSVLRAWESAPLELGTEWDSFTAELLSANIDEDAADELVYLGATGFAIADVQMVLDAPRFVVTHHPTPDTFASAQLAHAVDPFGETPRSVGDVSMPMVVEDLDGDDLPDVAAIAQGPFLGGTTLVVYWNLGGGVFDVAGASRVDLAAFAHGLVAVQLDRDAELEIVLADDAGGSVVQVSGRALGAAVPIVAGSPRRQASVAAADFDLDGVVDLAFGDDRAITFFKSVAGNE